MGGFYPTQRNFRMPFGGGNPWTTFPSGTFNPGGINVIPRSYPNWFPTNVPSGVPSTFDPRTWSGMPNDPWDVPHGKQPWDNGGKFPNPWRPKVKPFGKKFPQTVGQGVSLDPSRWARFGPIGLVPFFLPWFFKPAGLVMPPGWMLCWDTGAPKQMFSGPTTAFADTCSTSELDYLLSFQVPAGEVGTDTPSVIAWPGSVAFWQGPEQAGGTRMQYTCKWRRAGGGPATVIPYEPAAFAPVLPRLPSPDPNDLTPLVLFPDPFPEVGPVWTPTPEPGTTSYPPKVVAGYDPPGTVTTGQPTLPGLPTTVISTGGVTVGPPHVWEPPRTPESKYKAGTSPFSILATRLLAVASGLYNGITETVDLVAAIYSALPAHIIAQHPDNLTDAQKLPFMLAMIYQYRNQIDLDEAVDNVIANAVEDAVWGRFFQAQNYVRQQTGINYEGFDRELGYLNDTFREVLKGMS